MPVNLAAPTRELKRPLPASKSDKTFASSVRPPPLPSMRVRKGTVERDDAAHDDEWTLRAACVKARLLVAERESQLGAAKSGAERDWEALRARARATEEREWEMLRARVHATEEREWEALRVRAHATEARTRQEPRAREVLTGACFLDRDARPRAELGRVVLWP